MEHSTPRSPDYARDLRDLRILEICHYIVGALTIVNALISIPLILKFAKIASDPDTLRKFAPATATTLPGSLSQSFFYAILFGIVIYTVVRGALTMFSGTRLAIRKSRTFSFVLAAFNCASLFLGTALGIFTIIVLSRDSVKSLYVSIDSTEDISAWSAGREIPGARFGLNNLVRIRGGRFDGEVGTIASLLAIHPIPRYRVVTRTLGLDVDVDENNLEPHLV